MNPRLSSNFASSACAAGESSCPIGSSLSCLTLDALSISLRFPTSACAADELPQSINPAFPARPKLPSNSLQGHQLIQTLGPLNLWMQVQNLSKTVDITIHGAFTKDCLGLKNNFVWNAANSDFERTALTQQLPGLIESLRQFFRECTGSDPGPSRWWPPSLSHTRE